MPTFHNCFANLERVVSRRGGHYFDADTMRFFGTRTYDMYDCSDGAYLVVSDRDRGFYSGTVGQYVAAYGGRRYYRYVWVSADGEVSKDECEKVAPPLEPGSSIHAWWSLNTARKYARLAYDAHNHNQKAEVKR